MFKIDTFIWLGCLVFLLIAMVAGVITNLVPYLTVVVCYLALIFYSYTLHGDAKKHHQEVQVWVGISELTKSVLKDATSGNQRAKQTINDLRDENTYLKGQIETLKSVIKKAGVKKTDKTKKKNVKK